MTKPADIQQALGDRYELWSADIFGNTWRLRVGDSKEWKWRDFIVPFDTYARVIAEVVKITETDWTPNHTFYSLRPYDAEFMAQIARIDPTTGGWQARGRVQ